MTQHTNPLIARSTLPYGLPDYGRITAGDYLPAFTAACEHQRAAIDAITSDENAATFENTLVAWERSELPLRRVLNAFFTVASADASPEIQAVEAELAPRLAAHTDSILFDPRLYGRVRALWASRDVLGLDGEDAYLLERRYREMTHGGAGLDAAARDSVSEINQRLSTLTTQFERNLLADTHQLAVRFDAVEDLAGLSEADIAAARAAAANRGEHGFMLALQNFNNHPALAALTRRESRERLLTAELERGMRGNEHDNRAIVLEIVRLRARRAALLGYSSHAAYVTADQTAGSPSAVIEMLAQLAPAAVRNARAEEQRLQRAVDEHCTEAYPLRAWDWAYWTEQVRTAEYDVDSGALRHWLEAERVLVDGVFYAAGRLYGLSFTERTDVPVYRDGVRVFEVHDADGTAVGLYLLDLYHSDTKHGGAWMNPIVEQSELAGDLPVVINSLNVPRPAEGPTLLTLDETETLFHEFGHALHGLFARTKYPHFSGTEVFRDFVEFPSQVNEMWVLWPEVLRHYARHHETDAPLDAGIIDRLQRAATFNEGFATTEYLASAWLDFAWHSLTEDEAAAVTDVAEFERDALARLGLDLDVVPPRYRTTSFAHVFAGDYSAGYYSYVWSEVLDADAVAWFTEHGGLTRENGDRFRRLLLGVGGSQDPMAAYRAFRGRDARIEPLLHRRGLDG